MTGGEVDHPSMDTLTLTNILLIVIALLLLLQTFYVGPRR